MTAVAEEITGMTYVCPKCGHEARSPQALAAHTRYQHPKRKKYSPRKKGTNAHTQSRPRRPKADAHQEAAANPHVTYLFGRFEGELEHYARANRLSVEALAQGVAALLQREEVR